MDYKTLIKPEYLTSFAENYNYKVNGFMGQLLFPSEKTQNIKVAIRSIVNNGDLPVMAQVHALDTEARIGDRTNFKELQVEKLLIKEKLDQGESVAYYLNNLGGTSDGIEEYIFNDASNLLSRVIVRTEVAAMELLSTGKMSINENNISHEIDFGYDAGKQTIFLQNFSNADHDIPKDLQTIKNKAKELGFTAVRAITSNTVIGYMLTNNKLKGYWTNKDVPMTEPRLLAWINENYGIEFVTNDGTYKLSANGTEQKRFFDENAITFVGTRGALGKGLFGATPEELKLAQTKVSSKMLCTLTQWETPDPATTWTKASGLYLPVLANINKMIIAKVS